MAVKITLNSFKDIGRAIRFHRKKAGISANELALISGIGKTALYEIEQGKTGFRIETLLKVLDSLNISISLDSPLMKQFEVNNEKN